MKMILIYSYLLSIFVFAILIHASILQKNQTKFFTAAQIQNGTSKRFSSGLLGQVSLWINIFRAMNTVMK